MVREKSRLALCDNKFLVYNSESDTAWFNKNKCVDIELQNTHFQLVSILLLWYTHFYNESSPYILYWHHFKQSGYQFHLPVLYNICFTHPTVVVRFWKIVFLAIETGLPLYATSIEFYRRKQKNLFRSTFCQSKHFWITFFFW